METVLTFLPFAGLILSAVSGIWGLKHELTTKDEKNKRHLTDAGKYSVGFILLGLFISLNTGVLKTITDKQNKYEAARKASLKEQVDALRELTAQQQREEIIQTQSQEVIANQQRALAAQQRDFALSQQQLTEFNKAELLARQRTLDEVQRLGQILWDVRRTQYQIDNKNVRIMASLEISAQHPDLTEYSNKIDVEARRDIDRRRIEDPTWSGRQYSVSSSDGLPAGIPETLRNPRIQLLFYKRNWDQSQRNLPDLNFACEFYSKRDGMDRWPNITYSFELGSFRVEGSEIPATKVLSSSEIISVLDLPGATLEIMCDAGQGSGCGYFKLRSLVIEFSSTVELMIPVKEVTHTTRFGRSSMVYRFNSDEASFLKRYVGAR
jgi:hypothetical protein